MLKSLISLINTGFLKKYNQQPHVDISEEKIDTNTFINIGFKHVKGVLKILWKSFLMRLTRTAFLLPKNCKN